MLYSSIPLILGSLLVAGSYWYPSKLYFLLLFQALLLSLLLASAKRKLLFCLPAVIVFITYAVLLYSNYWNQGAVRWHLIRICVSNLGALSDSIFALAEPKLLLISGSGAVGSVIGCAAFSEKRIKLKKPTLYRLGAAYLVSFLLLFDFSSKQYRLTEGLAADDYSIQAELCATSIENSGQRDWKLSHRPNILLLVLESARRDHIHHLGYAKETTPFLDSFSKECIVFENHFSTSPTSQNALFSILTGKYPFSYETGELSWLFTETPRTHITEILKRQGYKTSFYLAGDATFARLGAFTKRSGFERIIDWSEFPEEARIDSWKMDDEQVLDQILESLERKESPQFITGFLMSMHHPFTLKDSSMAGWANSLAWKDQSVKNYDICVRYQDACLSRFISRLRDSGLLENTIIAITGDHGETFGKAAGDHGHTASRIGTLFEEVLAVPFYLYAPQLKSARISEASVHTMIGPLLLSYLKDGPAVFQAQLLRRSYSFLDNSYLYHCNPFNSMIYCIRNGDTKIIKNYDTEELSVYNLVEDPKERNDLAPHNNTSWLKLEAILDSVFQKLAFTNQFPLK